MKRGMVVFGGLSLMIAGLTFAWRLSPSGDAVREAHQREAAFRSLSAEEFDRLIEIAQAAEKKAVGRQQRFGGHGEPVVPAEFARYGFERVEVQAGLVEGRIYWLVDSGGFARVETRHVPPKILFVKGDGGEILDLIYTRTPEPNQSGSIIDND